MSKQKIIEAAGGSTEDKTLSAAADTTKPETEAPNKGDGKAPYREDFEAVYHRLDTIEKRLSEIEALLGDKQKGGKHDGDLESRVKDIERRLEGNIA